MTLNEFLVKTNGKARTRLFNESDYNYYQNMLTTAEKAAKEGSPYYEQHDGGGVRKSYGYTTTTPRVYVYVEPETHTVKSGADRVMVSGPSVKQGFYGGMPSYMKTWKRFHSDTKNPVNVCRNSLSRTNWSKLTPGWIPYDTAHYRTNKAREIVAELRSKGKVARLGSYVKDYVPGEGHVSYCKVYVKSVESGKSPRLNPASSYSTTSWPGVHEYLETVKILRENEHMAKSSPDPDIRKIAKSNVDVLYKKLHVLNEEEREWKDEMRRMGMMLPGDYTFGQRIGYKNPIITTEHVEPKPYYRTVVKPQMYTSYQRAAADLKQMISRGYRGYLLKYRIPGRKQPYYEIIGGYNVPPRPPRREKPYPVALNPSRSKTIAGNTLTVSGNVATYKTKDGHVLRGEPSETFLYQSIVQMAPNRELGHLWLGRFTTWLHGGNVGRSTMSRDLRHVGYERRF